MGRCDSINNQIDSPLIKKNNTCVNKKPSTRGPLLLLILIFGSIATPVYSQQERRLISLQNSQFISRHDRRGRRLRYLKKEEDNNKDNDKNDKKKKDEDNKKKDEEKKKKDEDDKKKKDEKKKKEEKKKKKDEDKKKKDEEKK